MIELKLNKSEFDFIYWYVKHAKDYVDSPYSDDDWDPNYKRLLTRLKNKLDMVID